MPDLGSLIDEAIGKLPPEALASMEAQQAVADAVRAGYEAGNPAPPNPVFVQMVQTFKDGEAIETEWEVIDRRMPKGQRVIKSHDTYDAALAMAMVRAPIGGGTIQAQWDDSNEYLHDTDMEAVGNQALYNVISGCGFTEGATMAVTVAAGSVTHNGTTTAVAGGSATLVSDASNKQWGYITFDAAGALVVVTGSPAASSSVEPTKPELGDRVWGKAYKIEAAQTASNAIVTALDKRIPAVAVSAVALSGLTKKYKTAAQTVSASTTFVDVAASSGSFAFAIAASEVWLVEYFMPLTFTGTGGAKFQLTGPASPTRVTILSFPPLNTSDSPTLTTGTPNAEVSDGTAFGATFSSHGAAASTVGLYTTAGASGMRIVALVANGSTAGTVTLQITQSAANGTTVAGIGSFMRAERIA